MKNIHNLGKPENCECANSSFLNVCHAECCQLPWLKIVLILRSVHLQRYGPKRESATVNRISLTFKHVLCNNWRNTSNIFCWAMKTVQECQELACFDVASSQHESRRSFYWGAGGEEWLYPKALSCTAIVSQNVHRHSIYWKLWMVVESHRKLEIGVTPEREAKISLVEL